MHAVRERRDIAIWLTDNGFLPACHRRGKPRIHYAEALHLMTDGALIDAIPQLAATMPAYCHVHQAQGIAVDAAWSHARHVCITVTLPDQWTIYGVISRLATHMLTYAAVKRRTPMAIAVIGSHHHGTSHHAITTFLHDVAPCLGHTRRRSA